MAGSARSAASRAIPGTSARLFRPTRSTRRACIPWTNARSLLRRSSLRLRRLDCGGALRPARQPSRVVQQIELVERPVVVTEHRAPAYWCARCRRLHRAWLPAGIVGAGLVGSRLTALVAWLKGTACASYATIQALLGDVLGVRLSTGQLVRLVYKASGALDPAYAELCQALPCEARVNVDETGHKERGKNLWTWCFRAPRYTLFKIDVSRGSEVLLKTLGKDFDGVLGCDYFSA